MLKRDKKKILFIVGILISIICSWLFARKVEWSHLSSAFRDAKHIYIIPTIILIFISHYFRAVRWSAIIAPLKKVSVLNMFSATEIGFMSNNIFPARIGEIIRPVMVARKENIKLTALFATVVMERIFDILSIIVFASLLFFFLPSDTFLVNADSTTGMSHHAEDTTVDVKSMQYGGKTQTDSSIINGKSKADSRNILKQLKKWSIAMAFLGVLLIVILFLLSLYPRKAGAFLEKLLFPFPHRLRERLVNLLHSFVTGLQVFGNKKQLIWVGGLSLIIWFFNTAPIYVLFFAFDIKLSFAGACLVMICLSLAVALPQAPGFIGVFHIATQKTLDIFGIGLASSQSYAIMLWGLSVIPITIAGLLFLWREGMSLGEISHFDEKAPEDS